MSLRLSRRQINVLMMLDAADIAEDDDNSEIVCEGVQCFVGDERTTWCTVKALLKCTAISDRGEDKGMYRFAINDTGRAIIRRPELAEEVYAACLFGKSFTIYEDRVLLL